MTGPPALNANAEQSVHPAPDGDRIWYGCTEPCTVRVPWAAQYVPAVGLMPGESLTLKGGARAVGPVHCKPPGVLVGPMTKREFDEWKERQ